MVHGVTQTLHTTTGLSLTLYVHLLILSNRQRSKEYPTEKFFQSYQSHTPTIYLCCSGWTHKVAYLTLALALSVGFLLFFFGFELFCVLFYLGVWGAPVRVEVAPLADVPWDDHVVAQQQDPVQVHRPPRHPQQQVLARVRPQQRHLQSKFYID